jgi:hypothetical protein
MNHTPSKTTLLLAIFLLCVLSSSYSFGKKEKTSSNWETVQNNQKVTVTGKVRLVGNEPFAEYVIADENDKQWYIDDESKEKILFKEQNKIVVTAIAQRKKMILANGRELEDKRVLTIINIIE